MLLGIGWILSTTMPGDTESWSLLASFVVIMILFDVYKSFESEKKIVSADSTDTI